MAEVEAVILGEAIWVAEPEVAGKCLVVVEVVNCDKAGAHEEAGSRGVLNDLMAVTAQVAWEGTFLKQYTNIRGTKS